VQIVLPALEEELTSRRETLRLMAGAAVKAWHPRTGHQLYLPDDSNRAQDQERFIWLEAWTGDAAHRSA